MTQDSGAMGGRDAKEWAKLPVERGSLQIAGRALSMLVTSKSTRVTRVITSDFDRRLTSEVPRRCLLTNRVKRYSSTALRRAIEAQIARKRCVHKKQIT